jgi:hypothetical protein
MSFFERLTSLALAIAILPVLHAEPHCPGNVPSLRLRLGQHSEIIVPVTINHSGPYDFVVDTGAQVSVVDPALAADLHLNIEGTTAFVGVGFHSHPSFAHPDTLEAGAHAIASPLVVIQNLGNHHAADPKIRGILGGNFLSHFDVLIDNAHGILCLDDRRVMQPEVKGKHVAWVTPPHSGNEVLSTEPLIISVQLSGIPTRSVLQLLDSGIGVPLLFGAGKEIRGGFSVDLPMRDRAPDGAERVFSVLPRQDIRIGALLLRQISFVTPAAAAGDTPKVNVDGLLPTALFRSIYISYSDHFVVLEPW